MTKEKDFILAFKKECVTLYNYLAEHNHGTQYEKGQIDLLKLQIENLEKEQNKEIENSFGKHQEKIISNLQNKGKQKKNGNR